MHLCLHLLLLLLRRRLRPAHERERHGARRAHALLERLQQLRKARGDDDLSHGVAVHFDDLISDLHQRKAVKWEAMQTALPAA